jgi:hypothetical protein
MEYRWQSGGAQREKAGEVAPSRCSGAHGDDDGRATLMAVPSQYAQAMTTTQKPTANKFWQLVPSRSPRGHESGSSSKGTNAGQCSPIPAVNQCILIEASWFFLDLGQHLGY